MNVFYKECVACHSNILLKAKKCEYCDSYQDKWKNRCIDYAPMSSAFIALLALTVTLAPTFLDRYLGKSAQVSLEILDARDGVLEIFANNEGNKGAVLGNIQLVYEVVNQDYCQIIDLTLDVSSRIVGSNDEVILTTKANPQLPPMAKDRPLSDEEREEYERYKSSDNSNAGSLSYTKGLDYAQRSEITVCTLKFSAKSSNVDIVPNPISYNCFMPEE
ncbi:hypothetical protein [Vibrio fluvialis]|uniref:hypothetical protein n=1 Tax=Vibrio fluvialis TaxID=676 RepID=UPI0015593C7F|nr:hypothetical protein [Vibrio fluvialis]